MNGSLHKLWLKQHSSVLCETDSKVALDLIIKGVHQYHPYATLVESIRSFLDRQWNISISYIFWEGNAIADRLVRQGASADLPLQVWDVCPPELSSLLSDVIGISIFRLV
ncbi:putative ribonuclease H protein [Glycine soja]